MTRRSLTQLSKSLYSFHDTCTVYVCTDGDACLLIDSGSGAIAGQLAPIGAGTVEWVLHTHHHRDQCWGTPALRRTGTRVAVPEYERHLFDKAELYWQTRRTFDNYDDRNTAFASGENIPVDAVLRDYEEFTWRNHSFLVLPAKGHTFGSVALIGEIDGKRVAFTGDLLTQGGKLLHLHAMEYTYGSMEGLVFTLQSIQALRKYEIDLALPSHGEPITTPDEDMDLLEERIMSCVRLGRGLHVAGETSLPETSFLPELKLYEISPHLLWGGPATCSNFYVVVSESRKALFIDYGQAFLAHLHMFADHEGLETMRFVEHRLDELRETWGVEDIDVVIPTHIHDDHTCGIPYLQRHHGTECWALDLVADVLKCPADWASTPCLFPEPIVVQRRLADGERFTWEGFEFSIHHAPGQTEWHATIVATIDGTKVAFTGDNYLLAEVVEDGDERTLPYQTTVLRNSFQLAMHRQCATLMRELSPQLICPGHGELLPCDSDDIDAYCDFVTRKEAVFRDLVDEPADHHIDLFWARLLPYLKAARPGERVEYRLILRNNLGRPVTYGARLHVPSGWSTSGQFEHLALQAGERGTLWLWAEAPERDDGTRRLVTAEIQLDGETLGPVVESLVEVEAQSSGSVR